jgi:hypothetical protein
MAVMAREGEEGAQGNRRASPFRIGAHCPLLAALIVAAFDRVAFVVELFASDDADLDLRHAALPVHAEGNKGESALFDGGLELAYFALVGQKLAFSGYDMIEPVSHFVFGNIQIVQIQFRIVDSGEAVGERDVTFPETFDFGARQNQPAFKLLDYLVIEERLSVLGD